MQPVRRRNINKAQFAQAVGYYPHAYQKVFHTSKNRFRIIIAGARGGKSMAVGFECAYGFMFPDFRTWIVGPKFVLADKELNWAITFLSRYKIKGKSLVQLCHYTNPTKGPRKITSPWGSFIETKSTRDMESLLGEELDRIALAEAPHIPREAWYTYLRARIGPRIGDMITGSTGAGDEGLFLDFLRFCRNKKFSDWKYWQFSVKENPTYPIEEYEQAKKELPKAVFDEQFDGKIVPKKPTVFSLDKELHLIDKLPDNFLNYPVLRSVVVGYQNPFVVLFVAVEPKTYTYYVYDIIYKEGETIPPIVEEVKENSKGRHILATLANYWAPQDRDSLKEAGLNTVANEKERGFGNKKSLIARIRILQEVLGQSGRIKIYNCKELVEEFENCKFPEAPKEESGKEKQEVPQLKYFRAIDALTYIVSYIESARGVNVYGVNQAEKRKE